MRSRTIPRNPGDTPSKRPAILRDWRDGYTPLGSARLRHCSVAFVEAVREAERQRRLTAHRQRRRLAMNGATTY